VGGAGLRRVIELIPVGGIPEVKPGDDLGELIADAVGAAGIGLTHDDVVVVTQKVVSKAEGRVVDLESVDPRPQATEWAEQWGKDARQVELVLRESADVVRWADGGLIISRTRHGFVCANAGVDVSNTGRGAGERATLLPEDPDASARSIRDRLVELTGSRSAVLVTDSFGRPWRDGITDVTIGAAGIDVLADLRGTPDADGKEMHATVVAVADELASAADLAAGKASGLPVVVVRGYRYARPEGEDQGARPLVMDRARNLFS
jgi:coenzyme F420-0:L-glutamate ligase/coenzyme F420-1:gamma-L-glutamate ligase